MNYRIERSWQSIDYPCAIILSYELGFRCGYVGVPEGHALHGVHYNEVTHKLSGYWDLVASQRMVTMNCMTQNLGIFPTFIAMFSNTDPLQPSYSIGVHGGITYSEPSGSYPVLKQDYWWFGYDCGHVGDGKEIAVINNPMVRAMYETHLTPKGTIRTTEYCFYECIKLADQLRAIDKEYKKRKGLLFKKF